MRLERLRWSALVFALLAVLLAGCDLGHSSTDPAPDSQQVLRIVAPLLDSLDPVAPDDYYPLGEPRQVLALLYSGLVTLDANLRPVPSDADHIAVSPDGLTYTLHLRSDLRFTDGAPITAADFAYSLNRAISPCGGYSQLLAHLKDAMIFANLECINGVVNVSPQQPATLQTLIGDSIVADDASTLRLTLDHPDVTFLAQLADPVFSVLDHRLIESAKPQWPDWTLALAAHGGQGTTGMYMVQTLVPGAPMHEVRPSEIVLVRNPRYWGPKPGLRELDITFSWPSGDDPYDGYHAGKYDLMLALTGADYPMAHGDAGFHQTPEPILYYLQANLAKPPFDDLRVRQAFALSIDKSAVAQAEQHRGTLPTDHLIPPGIPGYNSNLARPDGVTTASGAPEKARALWQSYVTDKCGGDARRCPKVTIRPMVGSAVGGAEGQAMLDAVQQALPGVHVELNTYQSNVLKLEPEWIGIDHLVSSGWAGDYPDPQDWLANIRLIPPGWSGRAGTDPTADAMLAQAEAATDPTARLALYQQLEQRMVDNVDVIPLYQLETAWVAKPYVRNYDPGAWFWVGPQQWAAVYIANH